MNRDISSSTAFRELLSLAEQFGSADVDAKALLYDPDQVIDSIERFGTTKLGEFEIEVDRKKSFKNAFLSTQEKYVICAFKGQSMLTIGRDDRAPLDWKIRWMDILEKGWNDSSKKKRQKASGKNDHRVRMLI